MLQSLLEDATKMLVEAFIWDFLPTRYLSGTLQDLYNVTLPHFAALFCVEFVHLQSPGLLECGTDNVYQQLQSLQNAAVRLIMQTWWHKHITPVLRKMHWFPGQHIVEFKLTILMFKALLVYYCHICEMNVVLCHGPKLVWVRGCLHSLLSLVLSVWKVHWEHNYTCSGVCWSYICLIVAIAHGHIYLLASFLGLAHCMRHCWFQCIGLSNSNQFPLSLQRKLSVVWTLLDRCSQMVTKEQDCQAEEAHIQQALYRCGYPEWTIERVKSDMEVQKGRARNRRSLDLSQ